MISSLINLFKGEYPKLLTVLVAMLPIAELRGAIPLALSLKLSVANAYLLSVAGNLIPILPVLLLLEPVSKHLRKIDAFDHFFNWLFNRTRNRSALIERLELIGLVLFVAVPLPMTGAWTGAVAAFLFRFRVRNAFLAIVFGVLLAGIVVTLTCLGFIRLVPFFLSR
ncbi:small multi-drug export protein [bacterium]|nr:small multi-drug export protein [bacterium]